MSQIFMNNQSIKFTYQASEPIDPFTQLMYILPKDSLGLLPEYIKNLILADDSNIKHNFPEDYDLTPLDILMEHTWFAKIDNVNDEEIKKFMTKIEWSKLTDLEKHRNTRGKMIKYNYLVDAQSSTIEPHIWHRTY